MKSFILKRFKATCKNIKKYGMFIKNFYVLFKNEQFRLSGFKPDNTDCEFLNDFKTSDIDQLILTLIFRFGVDFGLQNWT